uniref:Uncharacterized protein n=1 Tax=Anguilla anguilla TaxID=7936 RepID=A0A0E9WER6_ANGAN
MMRMKRRALKRSGKGSIPLPGKLRRAPSQSPSRIARSLPRRKRRNSGRTWRKRRMAAGRRRRPSAHTKAPLLSPPLTR